MSAKPQSDPGIHQRRSIRLKGYDYSQAGAYFITVCTYHRASLFGAIANGEMRLNELGEIAQAQWYQIPRRYVNIELDQFIVMPNHVHGILFFTAHSPVAAGFTPAGNGSAPTCPEQAGFTSSGDESARAGPGRPQGSPLLGTVMGAYKSPAANECLKIYKN